jgi:hypothetical protein
MAETCLVNNIWVQQWNAELFEMIVCKNERVLESFEISKMTLQNFGDEQKK